MPSYLPSRQSNRSDSSDLFLTAKMKVATSSASLVTVTRRHGDTSQGSSLLLSYYTLSFPLFIIFCCLFLSYFLISLFLLSCIPFSLPFLGLFCPQFFSFPDMDHRLQSRYTIHQQIILVTLQENEPTSVSQHADAEVVSKHVAVRSVCCTGTPQPMSYTKPRCNF